MNKNKSHRNYHLREKYGIEPEEYDYFLKQQHGMCAICNKVPREDEYLLAVDHCHKTDRVRGLLCGSCNLGLGFFKDDIGLLLRAALYLENEL